MAWCLPKYLTSKFLESLRGRELDPEKLINMTSEERRAFFSNLFGEEHGQNLNRTFESKLLLKDQQRGIINWAQHNAGLKPEAQRDIISRVNKMTDLLNPENEKSFLKDYASYKLGTNVTAAEANKISELANTATKAKQVMESSPRRIVRGKPNEIEWEYGKARVQFQKYREHLILGDTKAQVKGSFSTFGKSIKTSFGILKTLLATLDNSWVGRQGWKIVVNEPRVWGELTRQSFKDIKDTFKGQEVMDGVMADIYSRPNYNNYFKDKVALGVTEEAYPEAALIEKVPYVGKPIKAADTAFTAMAYRARADIYDLTAQWMQYAHGINDVTGRGLGTYVNSLTSRGSLGSLERAGDIINVGLFSGRKLRSDWDFLTAHLGQNIDPLLKKRAGLNLLRNISAVAGTMVLANMIRPGTANFNPTSADFGQLKIDNTRIDITGGTRWLPILAARLVGATAKTALGKNIFPKDGYIGGQEGGVDVVWNFLQSKKSPAIGLLFDIWRGHKQFSKDKKFHPLQELGQSILPLPIQNVAELKQYDVNNPEVVLYSLLDAFGLSVNTYTKGKKKSISPFNLKGVK